MRNVPYFQGMAGQEELTAEQQAYIEQFAQEQVATILSVTDFDETEAEKHLRLAYQVVGLEPPQIRWFDSPVAFVLAPESTPQCIETLIRTSVEARVATSIAESINELMWKELSTLIERVGQPVWYSVGRLIHEAVLEGVGRNIPHVTYTLHGFTRRDLEASLWAAAQASLWSIPYSKRSFGCWY